MSGVPSYRRPHPPLPRSPFSYKEKALTRRKVSEIAHSERHTFCFRLFSISARTLREGERVCRSPHPPRSGPPSPQGEGQYARESGLDCECRAFRAIADLIHRCRGPPSALGTASHVLQGEGLSAHEIVAGLSKSSPLCYPVSGLRSLFTGHRSLVTGPWSLLTPHSSLNICPLAR